MGSWRKRQCKEQRQVHAGEEDHCNDKVLKLFGRRVGLCVEWSDVNGVQVCCK